MENGVVRVPIKIRKAVQFEHCTCRKIGTIAVEGETCWHKVNHTNEQGYMEWLSEIDLAVPNYFVYSKDSESLIMYCLSRNIPVVVETEVVLPDHLMKAMMAVPHCAVHISLFALEESDRKLISKNCSPMRELAKMSAVLKTWKVVTRLRINCLPHLVPLYDYCEIFDLFRNYTNHAFIHIHNVSDEYLQANKENWNLLSLFSLDRFKQIYSADVPTRSWVLRPSLYKRWVKVISEYAQHKKVHINIPDTDWSENRVRLFGNSTDKVDNPDKVLGLRRYVYQKTDGKFAKYDSRGEEPLREDLNITCSYCKGSFY
ncbi:hypothetical protein EalM132_00116 [Exiguobacterium phage vB_EalM-132]|nr:hypothetical protein EalM132_00116 [Exiguobacterium phage vB_EalM-132]